MMRTHHHQQQEFNKIFYDLSSFVLNVIRSPPSPEFHSGVNLPATRSRLPPMTPGGFAAMLMGTSLTMMLCGSLTFFIGFMLMPWVIGLVMILYVVGIMSSLSMKWQCYGAKSSDTTRKEGSAWKIM